MINYFDQNMKAKKLPLKQQKCVNFHLPELHPSVKESFPPNENTVPTRQMSNEFQNKSPISKISCKNFNLQSNSPNIIINNNFTNQKYKQISPQPIPYVGAYEKIQSTNSESCKIPDSSYFRDPASDFPNGINSPNLIHNSTNNPKSSVSCSFPMDMKQTRLISISSVTKPKGSYWSSNISNQSFSYTSSPFSSRSITPAFSEASFPYDDFGKHGRFETIFENNTIRRTNDYNSSHQNNDTKNTREEDKSMTFKNQPQIIVHGEDSENKTIFSNTNFNSGNLMDMNTSYANSDVTDNETLNNKQETEVKKGHVRDHLNKFENMIGSGRNVIISPLKNGKFLHRRNKQLPSQTFCSEYMSSIKNNCFDHNNNNHYNKNINYDRYKEKENLLENNIENEQNKHNFTSSINQNLTNNSNGNSVEIPPHLENAFEKNFKNDSSLIKNQFRNGDTRENVPKAFETGKAKEICLGQERPRAKSLASNLLDPHRPYAAQPYIEISSSIRKQPKQIERQSSKYKEKPNNHCENIKNVSEKRKEPTNFKSTSVESSIQNQKYLPIIYTNAKKYVNGIEDTVKNNERTISDSEVAYQQNRWTGNDKTSTNFDSINNEFDEKRNFKYKEEKTNIRLEKLKTEEQRLRLRQMKDKQKKSVQRSSIYFQTSNNAFPAITPSCRAKVLFTFVPQRPNELALKKGEVVTVLRKIDSNWFKGKIGGQVGVFPSNYVQVLVCKDEQLDSIVKEALAIATHNFTGRTPLELSIEKGDEVILVRKIDESWFEGRLNGKQGLFPASYVDVIQPLPSVVSKDFSSSSRSNSVASNAPQLPSPWDSDFYESEVDQHESTSLPRNSSNYLSKKNLNSYESAIETSKSQDDTDNRIRKQTYFNYIPNFEKEHKSKVNGSYMNKKENNNVSNYESYRKKSIASNDTYKRYEDPHYISSQEIIQRLKSKVIDKYKVVFSYKAQNDDEMSLHQGEVISVVEKCADGWYVGFNERNKQFGTFPGNYVRML